MEDFGVVKGGHNQRGGLAPLKYFEEREGGVGLVTGGAPNREGKVSPGQERCPTSWNHVHRDITEAVHRHDSKNCYANPSRRKVRVSFLECCPSAIKALLGGSNQRRWNVKRRIHHSGFCQLRSVHESWVRRSRSDGK